MLLSPACHAEWTGEIRLLSEAIHRGYSASRGEPAAEAAIRYDTPSGWSAGARVSGVSFDDLDGDSLVEVRPSVAYAQALGGNWRADIGLSGYIYSGEVFLRESSYVEMHAAAHYREWFSISAFLAPDAYGRKADVPSAEVTLRRDLSDTLQISGGAGYTRASRLLEQDYHYWNAGLSWFLSPRVALDIRYLDAAIHTHRGEIYAPSEFYPRPQDHRYQITLTFGI